VIPYFFIVGFDKGDVVVKFFWYWLFQGLFMSTMVYFGHFIASILPNAETAQGMLHRVHFICMYRVLI